MATAAHVGMDSMLFLALATVPLLAGLPILLDSNCFKCDMGKLSLQSCYGKAERSSLLPGCQ